MKRTSGKSKSADDSSVNRGESKTWTAKQRDAIEVFTGELRKVLDRCVHDMVGDDAKWSIRDLLIVQACDRVAALFLVPQLDAGRASRFAQNVVVFPGSVVKDCRPALIELGGGPAKPADRQEFYREYPSLSKGERREKAIEQLRKCCAVLEIAIADSKPESTDPQTQKNRVRLGLSITDAAKYYAKKMGKPTEWEWYRKTWSRVRPGIGESLNAWVPGGTKYYSPKVMAAFIARVRKLNSEECDELMRELKTIAVHNADG